MTELFLLSVYLQFDRKFTFSLAKLLVKPVYA